MEREEQQDELKLTALRAAVDEGDASGIAEGNVFEKLRERLDLHERMLPERHVVDGEDETLSETIRGQRRTRVSHHSKNVVGNVQTAGHTGCHRLGNEQSRSVYPARGLRRGVLQALRQDGSPPPQLYRRTARLL